MLNSWVSRFRRDQDGSASIESLLFIPLFVLILVFILDVSMIFYGKAQALRIVQDGNRALSVGVFTETTDAENFISTAFGAYSPSAVINTSITDGIITTTAVFPARDLMVVGSIPVFANTQVSVTAQHFLEQ